MNEGREPLYIRVYEKYKGLIVSGKLAAGTKLPSIRMACAELGVSKTTVEAAYLQLEAEGYIKSKPQSGFYVTKIDYSDIGSKKTPVAAEKTPSRKIVYDFISASVDAESFDFNLWRRYVRSALKSGNRLLSYGEPQGEPDLRVALCDYANSRRGVICSPAQIVVGAGIQSLLQILCSIDKKCGKVLFSGKPFLQGAAVFNAFGRETQPIDYKDIGLFALGDVDYVYTNPSHINPWGDILPVPERLELLRLARERGFIIIEDDYNSEFQYINRPVQSLQGLDSGENVLYIGTFSKLLLPSLRIAFMVMPDSLLKEYQKDGLIFNQTASKAEQIALSQYLRDGNLSRQIKKARKLYAAKCRAMCERINEHGKGAVNAVMGTSGILFRVEVNGNASGRELAQAALQKGIAVRALDEKDGKAQLLLSCSSISSDSIERAAKRLTEVLLLSILKQKSTEKGTM